MDQPSRLVVGYGGVAVRVLGGVAAACVVAVSMICGFDRAFAEDNEESEANEANVASPRLFGGQAEQVLMFSGYDLWRSGSFAHGGILWSPDGLAQEGFTLKLLTAA